jgi:hypothetical protein
MNKVVSLDSPKVDQTYRRNDDASRTGLHGVGDLFNGLAGGMDSSWVPTTWDDVVGLSSPT